MIYKYLPLMALLALVMGCAKPTMEQRTVWIVDRISGELDLTPDQKTALLQIKDGFFEKLRAQKDARTQLKDDMVALIKSETIDPAKLAALKQETKDLNGELQDYIVGKFVDFHKTLTPPQKDKIAKWIEHISEKMGEMSGM